RGVPALQVKRSEVAIVVGQSDFRAMQSRLFADRRQVLAAEVVEMVDVEAVNRGEAGCFHVRYLDDQQAVRFQPLLDQPDVSERVLRMLEDMPHGNRVEARGG